MGLLQGMAAVNVLVPLGSLRGYFFSLLCDLPHIKTRPSQGSSCLLPCPSGPLYPSLARDLLGDSLLTDPASLVPLQDVRLQGVAIPRLWF